ncbi:5'-nucleotidase [Pyxidicoccus parkwayensis]|uniref:5'-nucleotidase n=1 Tax=Pyxidicoccus parkwayensis TaxID=2813578 RepID=UPI001F5127DA|nr:5'-nucleotidase [Pyxidicoccus parkwaysis]
MKLPLPLLLCAVLLLSANVFAAPRQVVLLFTGDNQGEIAPCGCKAEPQGGLARRKTAVDTEKSRGLPVVLLDAGNALFRKPLRQDEPLVTQRAELVLEQMESLGTAAMAVGHRDLSQGLAWLRKAAQGPKKKMKLLSANLVDKAGKTPFAASTVVQAGGLKVGVVGVSPEGEVPGEPTLKGRAPIESALTEARKLRQKSKVDVVVVLAAAPYQEAVKLALLAGDAVDFVVESHENKGIGIGALVGSHTAVFPGGELGRQLTRLELNVDGPGPSVDLGVASRSRQQLVVVEGNLLKAHERLAAEKDEATRADLSRTIVELEGRMRQLESEVEVKAPAGGRAHQLSYLTLGLAVADDPAVKAKVEQLEPPGTAAAAH